MLACPALQAVQQQPDRDPTSSIWAHDHAQQPRRPVMAFVDVELAESYCTQGAAAVAGYPGDGSSLRPLSRTSPPATTSGRLAQVRGPTRAIASPSPPRRVRFGRPTARRRRSWFSTTRPCPHQTAPGPRKPPNLKRASGWITGAASHAGLSLCRPARYRAGGWPVFPVPLGAGSRRRTSRSAADCRETTRPAARSG